MIRKKPASDNPLTWDDLANLYDTRSGGRRARTLPMQAVADWAKRQDDLEVREDDCFYRKAVKR